jgi:2-dehydro-3-deoxyphosphogluconate aldolase / (4S)-4-hydroxy-2-oxoglutarate aldolase
MTIEERTALLDAFAARVPVIPVLTLKDAAEGVAMGRALWAGGLSVLEVTLRTPRALEAIRVMRAELPECVIGAGTILSRADLDNAVEADAQFIVTPGTTATMAKALAAAPVPALPGCATVTEMLELAEAGFRRLKFFPAEAAGGAAFLKSVAAPVPQLRFCPTGGIDISKARDYLAVPNVMCVGGSWMTPAKMVADRDWVSITKLARIASQLPRM